MLSALDGLLRLSILRFMALLIPPGYAHVIIPMKHASTPRAAAVTFGIENNTVGFLTPSLVNDIQDAFTSAWNADSNVTVGPSIARFGQEGEEPLSVTGTATFTGTFTTNALPSNSALLVKKLTSRGGRRGRGRMYIPWVVDETSVDEVGAIDSTTLTAYQDRAINFAVNLTTNDTPMVLLHDADGSTAPGSPNLVTTLIPDPVIATQRRRLRG